MTLARRYIEENDQLNDLQILARLVKAVSVVLFCMVNGDSMHLIISQLANIGHQALDLATGEPVCPDLPLLEQRHQEIDNLSFYPSLLYLFLLTLSTLALLYTHDKIDTHVAEQQQTLPAFTPRR